MASLGAAPLGASNIIVMKNAAKGYIKKGMRIAHGAGMGEVMLVLLAIFYSQLLTEFLEMNLWVQMSFTVIFFLVGLYFIFLKSKEKTLKNPSEENKKKPLIATGFLFGFFNPPVFFYWIIVIALSKKYALELSSMSAFQTLLLFVAGVYTGKVFVLYFYGKISKRLSTKSKVNPQKLRRIIGIALITLSTLQGLRFLIVN